MLTAARAQAQQPSLEQASDELQDSSPSASPEPSTHGGQPDDPNLASARTLFWQGHEQYEQRNYAAAIALFEQSYAASPQAGTLFNVTLAMARDLRCDDATRTFHQFAELPMPEAELQRAAAIFASAQAECLTASAKSSTPVVAPQPAAPPPVEPPTPSPSQAPAPPPSDENSPKSTAATPVSEPSERYWDRDHVLGWSFAASAAVSAGAAVYFYQRQQSATDEAWRIDREFKKTGEPGNAADQIAELNTERKWFGFGTGVAVAASAGFAIAATKLLVFNSSSDGATQMAVSVSPDFRLAISGRF